jgi:beta-glucosidase/6-phospho-beta-glucosidase/beta-galactosidase
LKYVHTTFKQEVWVSECGTSVPGESALKIDQLIHDDFRVDFYKTHLHQLNLSIALDAVPVNVFLAWSLFDNFEWGTYNERFGIVAIEGIGEPNGTLRRVPKQSAMFLSKYFQSSKGLLNSVDLVRDGMTENDTSRAYVAGVHFENIVRALFILWGFLW